MSGPIVEAGARPRLLLGRYRLIQPLAEGGMGTVYLARTEGADGFTKPVVVKRMKAELRGQDHERLFSREANILSKFQHPAILSVIDFGVEDNAYIMVLDYVHGYSLLHWIDFRHQRGRPIPVEICVYIVRRVLAALAYAHDFEIEDGSRVVVVHSDVSPDNVLLAKTGQVRLLDFGIATIRGPENHPTSGSGTFRGKLGYAAPETLEGVRPSVRSDQYSTGLVLYELLTFDSPFASSSMGESVQRMMYETLPPVSHFRPEVPAGLDAVIQKSVSKSPNNRYGSVVEFSAALKPFLVTDEDELQRQLTEILRDDFHELPSALGLESLKDLELALTQPKPGLAEGALTEPKKAPRNPVDRGMGTTLDARPRLWKIAVPFAGLALLTGVLASLWSNHSETDQQVLVVGGDEKKPSVAATSAPDENSEPLATSPQARLERAIFEHGDSIQACFAKNLDDTQESAEVVLHFTLKAKSADPLVEVEPPGVARKPIGVCLKAAAQKIQFPPDTGPLSFRLPVKARVSRLKE